MRAEGEDHEAGMRAAQQAFDLAHPAPRGIALEQAVLAYLSRCPSPEATHDAYVEPLDGGHRGYQARCWDCDWTGPEHLRGPEVLGTPESRAHKNAARVEAAEHRAEFSAGDTNENG